MVRLFVAAKVATLCKYGLVVEDAFHWHFATAFVNDMADAPSGVVKAVACHWALQFSSCGKAVKKAEKGNTES